MELSISFLRCGATQSQLQNRFIGITDEPLSDIAKEILSKRQIEGEIPFVHQLYASGLLRSCQSAELAFPLLKPIILEELRAMDYGDYEERNYLQIEEESYFHKWAACADARAFPNGEDPSRLKARAIKAFQYIVGDMCSEGIAIAAVVTHKMVIDTILQRFCQAYGRYQDYIIPHSGGCVTEFDTETDHLKIIRYF